MFYQGRFFYTFQSEEGIILIVLNHSEKFIPLHPIGAHAKAWQRHPPPTSMNGSKFLLFVLFQNQESRSWEMHPGHGQGILPGIIQEFLTGLHRLPWLHIVGGAKFRMRQLQSRAMHQIAHYQEFSGLIYRMPRRMPDSLDSRYAARKVSPKPNRCKRSL